MSQPPIANNITANFVTSTKKDFYKNCLPGIKKTIEKPRYDAELERK